MHTRTAFCLTAVMLLHGSTLLAQSNDGGSILWLVPPAGRLEIDSEVGGTLSSSDFFGPSDIYVDVYEVQGTAGQSVTIDMRSDDFDALLFVVGPGLPETLWDDDSGGNCNARLTVRFLETGVYRAAATATGTGDTGVYTLTVSTSPTPALDITCGGPDPAMFDGLPVAGQIAATGQPTAGTLDAGDAELDDGSRAEVWELEGEAGETLTIRLESDDFDAYLYVTGPGLDGMITDDDSGGDLDSQIVLTLPASGTYRIIASSIESGGTGAYRLTVSR